MTAHGQFHWNELMTRNVEQAKKFYAETMGWTYNAMPMPGGVTYTIAMAGQRAGRPASSTSTDPNTKAFRKAGCPTSPSTMSTSA